MDIFERVKNRITRWSISREQRALESNLEYLEPDSPEYKATLKAISKIDNLKQNRRQTVAKVVESVGKLCVGGFAAYVAFKTDTSEEITKNRNSQGIFKQIFRF